MKRQTFIISAVLLVSSMSFSVVGVATAHSFRTGDNVDISNSGVIDETLFTSGRTIDINTTVNGDIFCAGQNVTIGGTVNGDIMCAAQTLTINGTVNGDVRLAGQTVNINSTITGNASIGSQSFTLSSGAKIQGDLSIGTSDSTLNGSIGRDLAVGGASVTISDRVGRNIYGSMDRLRLTSNAKVEGNITYTSQNELSKASGAVVGGKIDQRIPPKESKADSRGLFAVSFGWFAYCLMAMLFAALAFALLFPRFLHRSSERTFDQPLKTLAVGFLANLAVPVLLVVLAITVVGIPLAAAVGLLWLVILMTSGVFFAYFLGRLMYRRSNHVLLVILIGTTTLVILHFIPIIGFLAFLATTWFGTGMLLIELYSHIPKPIYHIRELDASTNHSAKSSK